MVVIAKARELPRVDSLLDSSEMEGLIESYGRALVRDAIRNALDWARGALKDGPVNNGAIIEQVRSHLGQLYSGGL